ncbi:hypothetical protein IJG91_00885 [Candidatus Saccharibacteria bacterium]|nr:hypothetical protein [Candidatus Saccharibacteria bacterium]
MADKVVLRKSRNVISSILHVLLNILLGVGSIAITVISGSWIIGLVLVLISKWRIFAVRPRFWFTNIKSSLVDLIVGASFVFITYCSGTEWLLVHIILALGYCIWLIAIKPLSSDIATEVQATFAMFIGSTTSSLLFASSNPILMTICCFIIGFSCARHILVQTDDNDFGLIILSCGLVSAEIAWLCNSWLIVYTFGTTGIAVPQISIILTAFTFLVGRMITSARAHDGRISFSEIFAPAIFSVLVVLVIVIWFSKPIFDV